MLLRVNYVGTSTILHVFHPKERKDLPHYFIPLFWPPEEVLLCDDLERTG